MPAVSDSLALGQVRQWIREQRKLRIDYLDEHRRHSRRTIWPIAVAYFETVRLIVAWCEIRQAFRHFRTDRIDAIDFLDEAFPTPVATLRLAWRQQDEQARRDLATMSP
jgi:predicted DNA-binding transcriptional regulator YafY